MPVVDKVQFFHNAVLTIGVVGPGSRERMPTNPNNV